MTRKRFVKLCMGLGYSRNEANAMADRARRYGMSYAARWEHEKYVAAGRAFVDGILAALGETLSPVFEEVSATVANVVAAVTAMVEKVAPMFQRILNIYEVSLVPDGGVPLNYGQNCDGPVSIYKPDPADDAMEPEPMWTKENPHLDGLRIHHAFVDELAASAPVLTHEEIKATTAKWPGTTVMVGVDLADGPDIAAEIHVAGGAENGD